MIIIIQTQFNVKNNIVTVNIENLIYADSF